MTKVFINTVYR